jgi:arginine exporter protein ArgO
MAQPEHDFWGTLSVVVLAIVGVAGLAVLISKNATTGTLIATTGSAFSNALGVAISPVTTGGWLMSSNFPIA